MAHVVAEAALGARDLDVVAQHQLVGLAHRDLGLVLVRAAGQREQLADPIEHAIARGGVGGDDRRTAGAAIDAEVRAQLAEGLAMGGLAVDLQDLVDELMRHLVGQHAHDLGPRPRHHQRARQLQRARVAHPSSEPGRGVGQDDDRHHQPLLEPRVVLPVVGGAQLAHQRRLEGGGQRRGLDGRLRLDGRRHLGRGAGRGRRIAEQGLLHARTLAHRSETLRGRDASPHAPRRSGIIAPA